MFLEEYKLKKGDTIAIVAPSSGKSQKFPHVYKKGIENLEKIFGLKIKEYPTVQMTDQELYDKPQLRAKDLNDAFADKSIRGIITTIGGDDSIRIIPLLKTSIIKKNPKLFMGYSDATVLLTFLNQLGLMTFHGPSVMAGFAQTKNFPLSFQTHIKNLIFKKEKEYVYKSFFTYCDGYADWADPKKADKINKLKSDQGWRWINGTKNIEGQIFGGCIEALEFMKATKYWPKINFWNKKIFFLETSEEKPSLNQVKRILRNYGAQGVFQKISAILFGRARDYTDKEKKSLEKVILDVVIKEFGAKDLPIITNMDFGHTDPQFILPLGANIKIDVKNKTVKLVN